MPIVNNPVFVAVKSAMSERSAATVVSADLTVLEAIQQFRATAKTPHEVRVSQQLAGELSVPSFDVLTISPSGQITKVAADTPLRQIAVEREVRTPAGIKKMLGLALEAQAYARVGSGSRDALAPGR